MWYVRAMRHYSATKDEPSSPVKTWMTYMGIIKGMKAVSKGYIQLGLQGSRIEIGDQQWPRFGEGYG